MTAKYAIIELNNGWVLSSEDGEDYFETLKELLAYIGKREKTYMEATG